MIEIGAQDREILNRELEALMRPLAPEAKARQDYEQLFVAIDAGLISRALTPSLERVLEITLSTDRIRRHYGPQQEQHLLRLYNRTPAGIRLRQNTKGVNQAIEALKDQRIVRLRFWLEKPGTYRLIIDTDQCQLTVSLGPDGVSVDQLAVGL